ncbi:unnamed protein product, partial [Vitis vinifera]
MASPSSATEVVTIDVHAAKELTNSGYRYLDVRTVEEFKKGHADVENILNIPYLFTTPEERLKIPEFLEQVQSACSKEDHLVVVIFHLISGLNHNKYNLDEFSEIVYLFSMNGCLGGVRSLAAASVLVNAVTSSSTFFSFLFCF